MTGLHDIDEFIQGQLLLAVSAQDQSADVLLTPLLLTSSLLFICKLLVVDTLVVDILVFVCLWTVVC